MSAPRPVALVTGGARGIGRAVVWRLASAGWSVVAVDGGGELADLQDRLGYRLGTAEDLRETVRGAPAGSAVRAVTADVREYAAVARVVAEVLDRDERLDAVVAAAGVVAGGQALWQAPPEQLDALLEVNVVAVAHLAACALPAMLAAPAPRSGRFVAVASAAAHRGLFHLAAYGASKAACVGLVRGLAADLRGTGITANVVSPGSTRTDMLARTAELYGLPSAEAFAEHALLERLLDADEVAAVVAFICSPESGAVTGAVLAVDGGLTT